MIPVINEDAQVLQVSVHLTCPFIYPVCEDVLGDNVKA